jgi:multidrug efflux system outer membrane protein
MTHFRFIPHATMAITLVALLTGCNLAPDYVRPDSSAQSAWHDQPVASFDVSTNATTVMNTPVLATAGQPPVAELGWKTFFHDPRLQALFELALKNNLDLRLAVQRVEQTRAQYGIAQSALWPAAQLNASATRTGTANDFITPYASSSVSNAYSVTAGLTSFQIDFFGRLRNLSEAAYQTYLSTEEMSRNVQITIIGSVAQQYFRVRLADMLAELAKQTMVSREESYALAKRRFEAGVVSELDLNQARSLLNASAADVSKYSRDRAQATNALEVLLGQAIPGDLPQAGPLGTETMLKQLPAGAPLDLLVNRPDILAAEHTLKSNNANIGAARAAFFPSVNLLGFFGYSAVSPGGVFLGQSNAWQVSPAMTLPIFNGGALIAGLDLVDANSRAAVTAYQKTVQIAFREVSDALAGEATYQAELNATQSQEQSLKRSLELSNLRYSRGVDSYLQVQIAQINYYLARQAALLTTFNAMVNRVQLYTALGGGLKP